MGVTRVTRVAQSKSAADFISSRRASRHVPRRHRTHRAKLFGGVVAYRRHVENRIRNGEVKGAYNARTRGSGRRRSPKTTRQRRLVRIGRSTDLPVMNPHLPLVV